MGVRGFNLIGLSLSLSLCLRYPELVRRANRYVDITGFGIVTVQKLAAEIYAEELKCSFDEAFMPSERWCYDFMKVQMKLSRRRVTGVRVSPRESDSVRVSSTIAALTRTSFWLVWFLTLTLLSCGILPSRASRAAG